MNLYVVVGEVMSRVANYLLSNHPGRSPCNSYRNEVLTKLSCNLELFQHSTRDLYFPFLI